MIYDGRQQHEKQSMTAFVGGDYTDSLYGKRYWACYPAYVEAVYQHVLRNPQIINVRVLYSLPQHEEDTPVDIVAVGPHHPFVKEFLK